MRVQPGNARVQVCAGTAGICSRLSLAERRWSQQDSWCWLYRHAGQSPSPGDFPELVLNHVAELEMGHISDASFCLRNVAQRGAGMDEEGRQPGG